MSPDPPTPYHLSSIILFLGIGLLFFGCSNDLNTIKKVTERNHLPQETGFDVEMYYSDSARLKVKMITPLLKHFVNDTSYIEFPKGVHAYFYDDSSLVKTELTSKYGIRYESISKIEVRDSVVLTNAKGERLNTQHLTWDEQKKKIYTNDFVTITTKKEIIYGDGLESDQEFSDYKIKNIKGSLQVDQ